MGTRVPFSAFFSTVDPKVAPVVAYSIKLPMQEQLRLRAQERVVATVADSVLYTEMVSLESQEEDAPSTKTEITIVTNVKVNHEDDTFSVIGCIISVSDSACELSVFDSST